jgi:hypothetical protein
MRHPLLPKQRRKLVLAAMLGFLATASTAMAQFHPEAPHPSPAPIPEPVTMVLVAIGAIGLYRLRRYLD